MGKYFVTGGTGFIGTAVVKNLVRNGHQVLGLARSDQSAEKLQNLGASVLKGDIQDKKSLIKGAQETDGVIHLGFIRDYENYENSCKVDQDVIRVFGEALENTGKLLIYTSTFSPIVGPVGSLKDETTPVSDLDESNPDFVRITTEQLAISLSSRGIRSMAIRLPTNVHGEGDIEFTPALVNTFKEKGFAAYVGEGNNHWNAVHKDDAAQLFRLAAENGKAGSIYHATAEDRFETKTLAEGIAKILNITVKSITPEAAKELLGFVGEVYSLNTESSAEKTKEELGWVPQNLTLLHDIAQNYV